MGGITIKNPGSGDQARVSTDGQLFTQAENLPLQHYISRFRGQAYQFQMNHTISGTGTKVVGHIRNNSPTLSLVATFARLQAIGLTGGTTLPDDGNYWALGFGRTFSSGGTSTTPINMNRNSGNAAAVIAYDNNPTLAGTFDEFDRFYPTDGGQFSFNKEGSLILGANDTLEFRFVTDHTAGELYARLTFLMMDLSDVL